MSATTASEAITNDTCFALDIEVKALKDKLAAADSRERILSQHLLDSQAEMAELQLKHDKDMAAVTDGVNAHTTSGTKLAMLSELIVNTNATLNSALCEEGGGAEGFSQQVLESLAAKKTFLTSLPHDEKVSWLSV